MMGSAPSEANQETLDFVVFSAGDWRVGLEARLIRGSSPAPENAAVGEIEAALGLPPTALKTPGQYLQIKRPGVDKTIRVGDPVELVSLPVSAIHPLPALLAARTSLRGLRGLAMPAEGGIFLLFDAGLI